jgi:ketosteroid isomerase-like protein
MGEATVKTGLKATLFVLLAAAWTIDVRAQAQGGCAAGLADLQETVQAEYAFSESAKRSVRDAFLEYLAPDSLVLEPGPTPGRAFYEAAKPSSAKLEWYPSAGAASGGLGFTTGPWIYTSAGEKHAYGHFVSVWKRQADCRWRVVFDGGISHDAPAQADPKFLPDAGASPAGEPPEKLVAQGAIDEAILKFQREAQQDGLAAGFRTYARDGDFRFYIDGSPPMGAGAASHLLKGRFIGEWTVNAQGRSANSALAYVVGEFTEANKDSRHSFLQIWQYDPKVANWGLRIFLQNP